MTNPMKGQVNLDLGDKTYKARLTIDAIMQIEESVGCGIIKLAQRMADGDIKMVDIVFTLLPALRGGGNDFTDKEVKEIVGDIGIVASAKAVAELLTFTLTNGSNELGEEEAKKKE